jgi:hypothetical protein
LIEERYYRKWSITYRGKAYLQIYGKKNAYDLLYRLSQFYVGLDIEPFREGKKVARKRKKPAADIKEDRA